MNKIQKYMSDLERWKSLEPQTPLFEKGDWKAYILSDGIFLQNKNSEYGFQTVKGVMPGILVPFGVMQEIAFFVIDLLKEQP